MTKQLDLNQRCHCCGGSYTFNIYREKMSCVDPECSAYNIEFTIPFKEKPAVVKHQENPRKHYVVHRR